MNIGIKLNKNFTTAFNKMLAEYGEDMARLNGFADSQLSYTDFIDNFLQKDTVADSSIDGSANVSQKDIVTLLTEMPKPHMKLLAYHKIYCELNEKYGFKTANAALRALWDGHLYLHDGDTSTFKSYCYQYDLKDLAEKGLFFIENFFQQFCGHNLHPFLVCGGDCSPPYLEIKTQSSASRSPYT